jgi:hypothetical protein
MRLPHIGVARSYYIIRSRQIFGGFQNREDMRRVNGFKGNDTGWNRIDAFVTFGAAPTSSSDPCFPQPETASERYDRLMMERHQREMIAAMDTGKGHPWGEQWKK